MMELLELFLENKKKLPLFVVSFTSEHLEHHNFLLSILCYLKVRDFLTHRVTDRLTGSAPREFVGCSVTVRQYALCLSFSIQYSGYSSS